MSGALSKEPKSPHTAAIIVTTVVFLPVLYVGLIFGFWSYNMRHYPSPTVERAFLALTRVIPSPRWFQLNKIWGLLDPYGASLYDHANDPSPPEPSP